MTNHPKSRCLPLALACLAFVLIGATAARAEGNKFYEACETFQGTYEERHQNCTPECEVTYICTFAEGGGRICSEDGTCQPIGGSSAAPASSATEVSEDTDDYGEYSDHAECIQAERSSCRDRCQSASQGNLSGCLSSCLDAACEAFADSEDHDDAEYRSGDSADSLRCERNCKRRCSRERGTRRRVCLEACERDCE